MAKSAKKREVIEFLRSMGDEVQNQEELTVIASEIILLFHKVLKGFRLYPMNNPVFETYAKEFVVNIEKLHAHIPVIPLRITKDGFSFLDTLLDGGADDGGDGVSWILFNDGIREIFFQRGLEWDEITIFFRILAKVTVFANEDYDIATLLWEEEFEHIGYIVEEELMESPLFDDNDFEEVFDFDAHSNQIKKVLEQKDRELNDEDATFFEVKKDFTILNKDVDLYKKLIGDHIGEAGIVTTFFKEIARKLLLGSDDSLTEDLITTASTLWEKLVMFGAFNEGVLFLKTLMAVGRKMADNPRWERHIDILKKGLDKLNDDAFIDDIFRVAEYMDVSEDQYTGLGELLTMIPSHHLPKVLRSVTTLSEGAMREKALAGIGKSLKTLKPLMESFDDGDWRVVRNAVTVLKGSTLPERGEILRKVINSEFEQVRMEALSVLLDISLDEALPALEKSVFSPDKGIRQMSFHKLVTIKGNSVKPIINRVFREQHILSLDNDELLDLFSTVMDSKRDDLLDLMASLLQVKEGKVRSLLLSYLPQTPSVKPIARQLMRSVQSEWFTTLSSQDMKNFMKMVRPEVFIELFPLIERAVFKLEGGMFNKSDVTELKKSVFSAIVAYKNSHTEAAIWLKKATTEGSKTTKKVLQELGV
ncbi:HEAT repeat domain-containing protein [bacterium]|nr:HEAT repeat domain-containing protein [bacterium]